MRTAKNHSMSLRSESGGALLYVLLVTGLGAALMSNVRDQQSKFKELNRETANAAVMRDLKKTLVTQYKCPSGGIKIKKGTCDQTKGLASIIPSLGEVRRQMMGWENAQYKLKSSTFTPELRRFSMNRVPEVLRPAITDYANGTAPTGTSTPNVMMTEVKTALGTSLTLALKTIASQVVPELTKLQGSAKQAKDNADKQLPPLQASLKKLTDTYNSDLAKLKDQENNLNKQVSELLVPVDPILLNNLTQSLNDNAQQQKDLTAQYDKDCAPINAQIASLTQTKNSEGAKEGDYTKMLTYLNDSVLVITKNLLTNKQIDVVRNNMAAVTNLIFGGPGVFNKFVPAQGQNSVSQAGNSAIKIGYLLLTPMCKSEEGMKPGEKIFRMIFSAFIDKNAKDDWEGVKALQSIGYSKEGKGKPKEMPSGLGSECPIVEEQDDAGEYDKVAGKTWEKDDSMSSAKFISLKSIFRD